MGLEPPFDLAMTDSEGPLRISELERVIRWNGMLTNNVLTEHGS